MLEAMCLFDRNDKASCLPFETVLTISVVQGAGWSSTVLRGSFFSVVLSGMRYLASSPSPSILVSTARTRLPEAEVSHWAFKSSCYIAQFFQARRPSVVCVLRPSFFSCFCSFIQGSQVLPSSSGLGIQTHPWSWVLWPHLHVYPSSASLILRQMRAKPFL